MSGTGSGNEISTEVSEVVGRVVVSWKGKDYVLENFGMDDWSAVQSKLLRDKRARMIQAAVDAGDLMIEQAVTDDEIAKARQQATRLREEAMSAAGNIAGLQQREYLEILNRPDGLSVFLFVMFERRYPGKFTIKTIETMLRDGTLGESEVAGVIEAVQTVLGISGGN